MSKETEICKKFKPTPQWLAEQFWNMDSSEQALFFTHLGKQSSQYKRQMQWCYLKSDLGPIAKETLMDLAAPCYVHLLRLF